MLRSARLLLPFFFLTCVISAAQTAPAITGFPPYGSFENGTFDGINRGILNTNFSIPIAHVKGRGLDFNIALTYDSIIWQPGPSGWTFLEPITTSLGWRLDNMIGFIDNQTVFTTVFCGSVQTGETTFNNYRYIDPAGTPHPFSVFEQIDPCTGQETGVLTGVATDNSGYSIVLAGGGSNLSNVFSPSGTKVISPQLSMTDANGNFISRTQRCGFSGCTETDYTDTLGHLVLKISGGFSQKTYSVLDENGTYQQYILTLTSFPVSTSFGCPGVPEFPPSGTASVNLPTQLQLPNGRSYTFTYESGNLRLQRVTLPTGGFYEYDYPTTGNKGINCSDGSYMSLTRLLNDGVNTSTWIFARDGAGTTTVTFPQQPYDAAPNQSTYLFANGMLSSQKIYQGAAGGTLLKQLDLTYAANNTPAATNNTVGSKVSRVETDFDNFGNLTGLREFDWGTGTPGSAIRSTSIGYLPPMSPIGLVNRPTNITVHDGSPMGLIESRADITYDEPANYSCITSPPPGHDDTNYGCSFLSRGNPTTITTYTNAAVPSGAIVRHRSYDSLGNLIQADSNVCQLQRFSFSSTTQFAFPDAIICGPVSGPSTSQFFTYNAFTGTITTLTDENNQKTTFAYDVPFNRITQVTRPDNQNITFAYDDTNVTVTAETPVQGTDRRRDITDFDGLARQVRQTIANNAATVISNVDTIYDPIGNIFKVSEPYVGSASDFTETHYDANSRTTTVIEPADGVSSNTATSYAYSGNMLTITDATGKQILYQLDSLGRIQAVTEPDVTNGNALTQVTSYAYTVRDELKQISQGSQTRSYVYDDAGRPIQVQTPESGTVNYVFNQFNLPSQRTDARGVVTTYSYDLMNRLTQASYNVGATGVPATPTVSYAYGSAPASFNNGRLLTMTDGLGSETYSYDLLGRTTNIARVISTRTYNIGYGYDLGNQIASTTYPSGRIITQNHDSFGRSASVTGTKSGVNTTYASNYAYNPALKVTGLTYGNNITAAYGFNPHNFQLTSMSYSNPAQTLFSVGYGHTQNGGNNGEVTQATDNVQAGRSLTYTYDALRRLQTAVTSGSASFAKWGLSFAYDRYANRTNQTVTAGSAPSQSAPVDAATNHITGYTYDANGNLTLEPIINFSYAYDADDRLVNFSGNGTSSFAYDGNGLRAKKIATDGTVTYYIFSQGHIIAEYLNNSAAPTPGREYVFQEDGRYLVTIGGNGTLDFYHPDNLSVRLVTDASGNQAGERGGYPYGELWYSSGFFTRNNFSTYTQETESTTDYAYSRYYSLRTGRFMQADPLIGSLENPQSWNRLAYSLDDPINGSDPFGLETVCGDDGHGNFVCHTVVTEILPPDFPGLIGGGPPAPISGGDDGGGGGAPGRGPKKPGKARQFFDCVKKGGEDFSLQSGVQSLSHGKLGNGLVAHAFLSNSVSEGIGFFEGAIGSFLTSQAIERGAPKAAQAAASVIPDVSITTTTATTVSAPSFSLTVVKSSITNLPFGSIASSISNVATEGVEAFGKVIKLPVDLSVSGFSAVVCSIPL
ncbi:MAG TPA: RHS repeat-associated core domain-containing protein [Candidatus Angelobacter sp.]|jgi:RHS repeat-associated protein